MVVCGRRTKMAAWSVLLELGITCLKPTYSLQKASTGCGKRLAGAQVIFLCSLVEKRWYFVNLRREIRGLPQQKVQDSSKHEKQCKINKSSKVQTENIYMYAI